MFVKHIGGELQGKKADLEYSFGTKDDAKLKKWLKCPYVHGRPDLTVPENLLPVIKALFLCYSQENSEELLGLLA